jgi:uncharacterized phage protein (TIGR02218 family)
MKNFAPLQFKSPTVGFPARLCTITRLNGDVYRVAESDLPITVGGNTYAVVPGLQISAVKHTSNGEMPSCQIVAVHNRGTVFDSNDIDVGLFDGATIQIYVIDRLNITTPKLLFTGAIGNISYGVDNQVVFDVQGASAFAKILMTQKRSPMCRTDLFSVLCGVDKTAYAVAATVTAIQDAYNFTVSGPTQADGWFTQGTLITETGTALEIANWSLTTHTITTYLPSFRLLAVGAHMTLYPGCDKTMTSSGCGKFNNQLNFQGEPHFTGTAAAAQQVG